MFLFIKYFWSFWFFDGDIAIGWSERFEGIVISDILINLERRDFNIFLSSLNLDNRSFSSEFLIVFGRDRDILDDGNI